MVLGKLGVHMQWKLDPYLTPEHTGTKRATDKLDLMKNFRFYASKTLSTE